MVEATLIHYLAVLGLCVGIAVINQIFRYFFGMNPQQSMEMQQKLRDMQEEMMAHRDDPVAMQQIQQEAMQTYRTMMRKQLIPNCIFTILFLGLWLGIRGIFEPYDFFGTGTTGNFFYLYLIFSLSISGLVALGRYLIRHIKRKKGKLPDENYDSALDRGIKSGLRFGHGWNAALSPELQRMRSNLTLRQEKGELPQDIDIDAEINKLAEEEKEDKRDWKKRLDS